MVAILTWATMAAAGSRVPSTPEKSWAKDEEFADSVVGGDVDGDGVPDVVISGSEVAALQADHLSDGPRHHVDAMPMDATPAWTPAPGVTVALGAFGGPKCPAIVVGAHGWWDDGDAGELDVLPCATSWPDGGAPTESLAVHFVAEARLDLFAASRGDLDGDGFDDLVVSGTGGVRTIFDIYSGSPAGLDTDPIFASDESSLPPGGAITGAAYAGDVDGDGLDDLIADRSGPIVLLADGSGGVDWSGIALSGSSTCVDPNVWSEGNNMGGHPLGAAGDIDGDGYADGAVVQCVDQLHDTPSTPVTVSLYTRIAAGSGGSPVAMIDLGEPIFPDDRVPGEQSVTNALGDLDGDGFADFGAQFSTYTSASALYVCFGSADPTCTGDDLAAVPPLNATGTVGFAPVGDVNGDGFDDFVLASSWDGPHGEVALFEGNAWTSPDDTDGVTLHHRSCDCASVGSGDAAWGLPWVVALVVWRRRRASIHSAQASCVHPPADRGVSIGSSSAPR